MLPLEGITVISLEHAVAAPFRTRQLADLAPGAAGRMGLDFGTLSPRYLEPLVADVPAAGAHADAS